jgi:two-component system NtrC family sensor kinase
MKNAVRALSRGDLSAERTTLYLDLITDGLSRVEQTVKKFLTFTPRAIEPHPVDLVVATQKGMALAMHRLGKKHIELTSSFPEPGTAIVFGDPHELQQVALNLLLNAADAIDAKAAGRVEVAIERRGDEVVLSVKDDGHGMSPEDQGRCFDIFYTTKPVGEGTGMGLAVVHTIVTNHGGRIEVTSAVGEGASFHVFLPAEPAVDPAEPAGAHSPGAAPEA